jgi:hypothetical protein
MGAGYPRRVPPSSRAPLVKHPGRVAIVVGTLIVVLNLIAFLAYFSDTDDEGRQRPTADVEQVKPGPGSIASPQEDIEVHLRSGLTGVLVVDQQRIPEDQLEIDNATSTIVFRPGPGKDFERLRAGPHAVTVLYWKQTRSEPSRPERFDWSFQVAA